jgi:hypothetical protein
LDYLWDFDLPEPSEDLWPWLIHTQLKSLLTGTFRR